MSELEKKIDDFIASTLQEKRIDFLRIKNSNFRGGYKNYDTTAFKDKFSCDKNWCDFMFAFGNKTYLIENGIKSGNQIKNQDRKNRQSKRMKHWVKNGGCKACIVTSIEGAKKFFKKIKLMEI